MKRRTLTSLALTGLLGVAGCGKTEPVGKGVILSESFSPGSGFFGSDRYTTIIDLLGNKIAVFHYGSKARVLDLLYNVGDTVLIEKLTPSWTRSVNRPYFAIVDPLTLPNKRVPVDSANPVPIR